MIAAPLAATMTRTSQPLAFADHQPRDPGNGSNEVPTPGTPGRPRDTGDGSNGVSRATFESLVGNALTLTGRSIEMASFRMGDQMLVDPAVIIRINTQGSLALLDLALGHQAPQSALDAVNGARLALGRVQQGLDRPDSSVISTRGDLVAARDLLVTAVTEYKRAGGPQPTPSTDPSDQLQGNGQGPDFHPPALDPGKDLQGNGQGPDIKPAAVDPSAQLQGNGQGPDIMPAA